MDLSAQYCFTRRSLEERSWSLASRLSGLSAQLLFLVGGDRVAFLSKRAECRAIYAEITDSRERLRAHRAVHGC